MDERRRCTNVTSGCKTNSDLACCWKLFMFDSNDNTSASKFEISLCLVNKRDIVRFRFSRRHWWRGGWKVTVFFITR